MLGKALKKLDVDVGDKINLLEVGGIKENQLIFEIVNRNIFTE